MKDVSCAKFVSGFSPITFPISKVWNTTSKWLGVFRVYSGFGFIWKTEQYDSENVFEVSWLAHFSLQISCPWKSLFSSYDSKCSWHSKGMNESFCFWYASRYLRKRKLILPFCLSVKERAQGFVNLPSTHFCEVKWLKCFKSSMFQISQSEKSNAYSISFCLALFWRNWLMTTGTTTRIFSNARQHNQWWVPTLPKWYVSMILKSLS